MMIKPKQSTRLNHHIVISQHYRSLITLLNKLPNNKHLTLTVLTRAHIWHWTQIFTRILCTWANDTVVSTLLKYVSGPTSQA